MLHISAALTLIDRRLSSDEAVLQRWSSYSGSSFRCRCVPTDDWAWALFIPVAQGFALPGLSVASSPCGHKNAVITFPHGLHPFTIVSVCRLPETQFLASGALWFT